MLGRGQAGICSCRPRCLWLGPDVSQNNANVTRDHLAVLTEAVAGDIVVGAGSATWLLEGRVAAVSRLWIKG